MLIPTGLNNMTSRSLIDNIIVNTPCLASDACHSNPVYVISCHCHSVINHGTECHQHQWQHDYH